ncbi:MAG: ATP-binding protein [Caldimonas sp.]
MPPATATTVVAAPPAPGASQWTLPLGTTTLACIAAGFAASLLVITPGQSSPLDLAAGIALAAVLVFGRRMLFGVALAAFIVELGAGSSIGRPATAPLAMSLLIALAAALQAGVGDELIRRFVRQPLTLTQPHDVAMFFTACVASSLVAASLTALGSLAMAGLTLDTVTFQWAGWWIGDLAGLLIGTPIVLTLIGRPRSEWRPRRLAVGLTMTLVVAFLALAIAQAARWNDTHALAAFDADAARLSTWTFSALGLLSAAILGASLLITTGRTRRIETAVRERTAALRAEVGERHVAEQALRASEQRFRNILDNVPIGVVYTDLGGRVIQANPRYCELTGYSESELAALGSAALVHPDEVDDEEAMTAQLMAGAIPMYRRDKRCLTKGGEAIQVRATISLLRDANNEPWRIVGVIEDISEQLRLKAAEHAREAAEASNRAKSEFLSRMSHELRTPLNAMLGFAQLLEIDQRHPLAPPQRPWVAQIQQAGWHLLDMINDVLDLSRIESDNLRLQTATLDLPEIVTATVALVASDAARRGIRISEDLAQGTAAVVGDATRVKQILTNLLSNAVKYNVDGGRVHVVSRVAGAELVEISVIDTGLGMSSEQIDQLFRPFNRLGRERTTVQGTGIGLVISRRLAELMGGSIRVKSMPGEGSSFTLKLPKAIDPDTVRSSLDALGATAAAYRRRTVHYVEDNETNVEVMRGILAQRAQVELAVSVAGLDGLAAVRSRLPHLILLDMHLPDISGLELLRHLKTDPATAAVPVIAVSADATAEQIDAALDAGAVRYLTKPVDVTELLAAVDDLLDPMDTGFS